MSSTSALWNSSAYSGSLADSSSASSQSSDRLASDKFTFLKLLVAQLQNQDPLNPTEDQDFVAQLAQFTSLEQLQEINEGVGTLNDTMHQGQLMSATSFIGKAVAVSGSQITKTNDSAGNIVTSWVYYSTAESFEKGYVTIMDSTGSTIIRQDTIDGKQAGIHHYEWDGKNDSGKEVAEGVYQVIIATVDENDKSVLVDTQFEAQVTSVYIEDGVYYLALSGGRSVALTDVIEVGNASQSTTTAPETYSGLASDQAAKAALAADSAAAYEEKITAESTSSEAKSAADGAVAAAATARKAADKAEELAAEARKVAESEQTAAALSEYTDTREWADKAVEFANTAEGYAASAKDKALAIDPDLEF